MYIMTGDTSYISQTVIDGNQNRSVVKFHQGESIIARLTGFTVRNGTGNYCYHEEGEESHSRGGGIYYVNSNPTIDNLVIEDNSVFGGLNFGIPGFGAGIHMYNSNVSITNIIIRNNECIYGDSEGGGIYLYDSNPIIRELIIHNNTTRYWAGMYCHNFDSKLDNVLIHSNHALVSGGGLYLRDCSTFISNLSIMDNLSDNHSGGVLLLNSTKVTIQNSIIWETHTNKLHVPPMVVILSRIWFLIYRVVLKKYILMKMK